MGQHTTFIETVHQHLNDYDFEALRPLFAADVETRTPGGTLTGFEEWRAMGEAFKLAAPDGHHQALRQWEDGDSVIVEGVFAGTHTGPLTTEAGQLPASGNAFALPYVDIFQLSGGVCVSHRVYWDNAGFMMQLGAMG
jgi:ketosteroid isomerase-like protein